jgi:DHA1 family bicyclomycin/chloramphenicol resistance-like MFS transporter
LALLVCTSLVMPLSLDMYTPAIPHMAEHLDTTEGMVNLTLVGYYLFFAIGLLVFGPLSDRRGRKPVLVGGLIAYTLGAALCALSPTIEVLILARIIQALGAGAADSMTNSIAKDAIVPQRRQLALSFIQLMFIVGPVVAPILGAFIVSAFSWHMTFWALTCIGAACCVFSLLFDETLPEGSRATGSGAGTVALFRQTLSDRGFTSFLLVMSLYNVGFMAYISVASYIYITYFGLSEMGYSLYFSVVALFTALGPFIWEVASRVMRPRQFLGGLMGASVVAGVAMLAFGHIAPLAFCIPFLVFAVCEAAVRPLSVNILLSQADDGAGTASSTINFVCTAVGCVGMLLSQLPWPDYITGLGIIIVVSMGAALAGWVWLLRSGIKVKGL